MQIRYHKQFEKRFAKLAPKQKQKVIAAIELFAKDPTAPRLRNHALTGALVGLRAISATGDMRIVFQEYNQYVVVVMLDVGTHNQVY